MPQADNYKQFAFTLCVLTNERKEKKNKAKRIRTNRSRCHGIAVEIPTKEMRSILVDTLILRTYAVLGQTRGHARHSLSNETDRSHALIVTLSVSGDDRLSWNRAWIKEIKIFSVSRQVNRHEGIERPPTSTSKNVSRRVHFVRALNKKNKKRKPKKKKHAGRFFPFR